MSGIERGTPTTDGPTVFYPARFHADHESRENADVLELAPGDVSPALLLTLRESGGLIRCLVVDSGTGLPIEGVLVEAIARRQSAFALTDGEGIAVLTGVPSGRAVLRTRPDDPRSKTGAHAVRFAPGVINEEDAAAITVVNGRTTDAGEVRIPGGGRIKATVLRPDRSPWNGASVVLHAVDPGFLTQRAEHLADHEGRVTFGGLEPGGYRLWVDASGSSALTECWDGSRDTSSSSIIEVERGQLRSGITISMNTGGVIRGSVRNIETLEGYPGIEVDILSTEDPGTRITCLTDEIGFYEAVGLRAGSYKVYVPEIRRYYPDAMTLEQARAVLVGEGSETSRIDIKGRRTPECQMTQETAGAIQGTIRADFLLMRDATVMLWSESDTIRMVATEDGVYTIPCLVPGMYRAALLPHGAYRSQYHPRTNDPNQASLIAVAAGDTAERIDFEPERGIEIRGSVVATSDGQSLSGIPVTASLLDQSVSLRLRTGEDGVFHFDRMPDGTGIPSGKWIVGSDSTTIPLLRLTASVTADISLERTWDGVLVRFGVPESVTLWDWHLEYAPSGGVGIPLCSAADHPDGTSARDYLHKGSMGALSYRLTVWVRQGARLQRIESSWVEIPPIARIWPNPWNGRGLLTISVHRGAIEDFPAVITADGRCIFRLERAGTKFRLAAGDLPAAGVYFLRCHTRTGDLVRERLVLEP